MPELEDQSILNHSSELMHINFRNMRQTIEHEMIHLRQQIAAGNNPVDASKRITQLIESVREAKRKHEALVRSATKRAKYWTQYQRDPLPSPDPELRKTKHKTVPGPRKWDLSMIVSIGNYLAERGCYRKSMRLLLQMRPDIKDLLDLEAINEENDLVDKLRSKDYIGLLKWCRAHRSGLKRSSSKLELHVQLKQYANLIREGRTKDALEFGKKAFSKPNPLDYSAIMDATSSLYYSKTSEDKIERARGSEMADSSSDTSMGSTTKPMSTKPSPTSARRELTDGEVINMIRHAVRQVYRRPVQNPLVNQVLLGSAALKTYVCVCGFMVEDVSAKQPEVCPLCASTAMTPLYDAVPTAQHTRSHLDPDLRMFPSGSVIGLKEILKDKEKNYHTRDREGHVADPDSLSVVVPISVLKKVYAL